MIRNPYLGGGRSSHVPLVDAHCRPSIAQFLPKSPLLVPLSQGFRITLLNEPASGSDRRSQIYDHRIIIIATCIFTLPHSHLRLIVAALGTSSSLSSHCHAYGPPPLFHQVDLKTTSFTYR